MTLWHEAGVSTEAAVATAAAVWSAECRFARGPALIGDRRSVPLMPQSGSAARMFRLARSALGDRPCEGAKPGLLVVLAIVEQR